MNFDLRPELSALREQIREFMEAHVLPAEKQVLLEDHQRRYETLHALQTRAKEAGLFTPHLPEKLGGRGLGVMGMCVLFREMGRSPVGAKVFNCDAPDQGNMDLLISCGCLDNEEIRTRYLEPLCNGKITSAFCMTEPAPGAGADPQNLRTTATQEGDSFVISGHKWYSTGGEDASFLIVMARTSSDAATLFLVDRNAPGVEHVREIPTMAPAHLTHREAEMRFHNVRVSPSSILGGIGQGFRLAQKRLVPARLTHCMRWLGLCDRTLELCKNYIRTRRSFGKVLAEHQAIQQMIARAAAGIHAGNLMTFHCAAMLERGEAQAARPYSSMAKNHVARLLCQTLDDAIQMHGSLGYSEDMPFSLWYRIGRAARIADGPDEVHDMVVARDYLKGDLRVLV